MGRESFDVEKIAIALVMNDNVTKKRQLAKKIFDVAYEEGVYPSSIHEFYMARGRAEFGGFTVPAINLRSMTYDLARAILRVTKKNDSGACRHARLNGLCYRLSFPAPSHFGHRFLETPLPIVPSP